MPEPTVPPSSEYDNFVTVFEKKAYHDFLLARGSTSLDRRPRKGGRAPNEASPRPRRFRAVTAAMLKWLGVFVGGCVIGSALTQVSQGRPTMGRAGLQVAAGFGLLALAMVVGWLSRPRYRAPA